MTGIQDDLATLARFGRHIPMADSAEYAQTLSRVEAEIAWLKAENKQLRTHGLPYTLREAWARAEAAEAEVARLRDGLRELTHMAEVEKRPPSSIARRGRALQDEDGAAPERDASAGGRWRG